MDFVKAARDFALAECDRPASRYGAEPFENHFAPTVSYAQKLAKRLEADMDIVTIAAWLHDIGSIIHGRKEHHETGAAIARAKLDGWGYPPDRIERVVSCIRNHRGSVDLDRKSIEEQIVSDADAMSNFSNVAGIFKAALVYEGLSQADAAREVVRKLDKKLHKLHFEESREMIRPLYEAAMLLFGDHFAKDSVRSSEQNT